MDIGTEFVSHHDDRMTGSKGMIRREPLLHSEFKSEVMLLMMMLMMYGVEFLKLTKAAIKNVKHWNVDVQE